MNKVLNYFRLSVIIILVLLVIIGFKFISKDRQVISYENFNLEVGVVGDDFPVTRALVAKMLSLVDTTKAEINLLDRTINFIDTESSDWYDKYINYIYQKGIMSGINENEFDPNGNLTLEQAQFLINQYDKTGNIKIKMTDDTKAKPITYALWFEIYKKIVDTSQITEDEVVIIATNSTSSDLTDYNCATDKGILTFEGIDADYYINKKIKILRKDNEVLGVVEVLDKTPTLSTCFISKVSENSLTIFISGVQKTFYFEDELKSLISLELVGSLADVVIEGDSILSIDVYKEYIRGNVNLILDNTIRINNVNYIKDENIKVYSALEEQVKFKDLKDLIIGQDIAKYFVKEGDNKIYGVIIDKEQEIDKVRVAIRTDDYTNLFFENLKINSDSGIKVLVKGQEKEYPSSYTLEIGNGKDFSIGEKEIIKIEALNQESGLNLVGLKRGYENPNFKGTIEICKIGDKYLVINEVSLNDYIKSVISSNTEIPTNTEVLKSFSVILRTNTINKINENTFYEYGANFDDSSSFQLYNNLKLNSNISEIVDGTENLVIKSNDELVNLNYFAYSAGVTGNSGEIWANKKTLEFPTETLTHLQSIQLFEESIFEELDDEINANIFFKSKDITSIESDSNWFRWSCVINLSNFNQNINEKLKNLYLSYPNFIKTLQDDGTYKSVEIGNVSNIKDIKINKRGQAGNIMEIEIFTDTEQIILMTDTVIKQFFTPDYVINNNGERIESLANLPSSYFVFDKIYDDSENIEKLNFYGGGYGHGVGLSIYGAKKMSENGSDYLEILSTFYSGIEIVELY